MRLTSRNQLRKLRELEDQGIVSKGTVARALEASPPPEKLPRTSLPAERMRRSNRAPARLSVTREARRWRRA